MNFLTLSLYFLLYCVWIYCVEKVFEKPNSPPSWVFFSFKHNLYFLIYIYIYIEIYKSLFLNFWNPQFFINLVIQYLQTLDMSISCLQSFIAYPLPPTQSFFTYKFVPIWKYWPILVLLLCGNIEDRRQRRRRCFHKRAILILTLNKIAIMSENYINIVVKLSLWGWSCYLISTIEERSVSFQQTSREVHLIYLIIFEK